MESNRRLLIRIKRQSRGKVRHGTRNQATVIPPHKRHPGSVLRELILQVSSLFENFIMIDAEHLGVNRTIKDHSAIFRGEVAGSRMSQHRVCGETVQVCQVDAAPNPIDLRLVPGNWKRQRSVEEHIEVIGVVRELIEIIHVHNRPAPDCLFKSCTILISPAGLQGRADERSENIGGEAPGAGFTRQNQIFIVWSLQKPTIRQPQDSVGALDPIGHTDSRLQLNGAADSVIPVAAQAQIESPLVECDVILRVKGWLADGRAAMKIKRVAPTCQVKRKQPRQKGGVCLIACRSASSRTSDRREGYRRAAGRQANRVKRGIRHTKVETLRKSSIPILESSLGVVNPSGVSEIKSHSINA